MSDSLADLQTALEEVGLSEDVARWNALAKRAATLKASAERNDRNSLWSVESYAEIATEYITAIRTLRDGGHYEGWCALERVEIGLKTLIANPFEEAISRRARPLAAKVALWQSLFPYRVFASPGFRYTDWKCSLCGKKSTPVSPCGHTPGKVYEGELCTRIITAVELLEISLVTNPVQKYSVMSPSGGGHNYSVVDFVLASVPSAFHPWGGLWTHKRHDHALFPDLTPASACPCESNLRYGECCQQEPGVRLRHFVLHVDGLARQNGGDIIIRTGGTSPEGEV